METETVVPEGSTLVTPDIDTYKGEPGDDDLFSHYVTKESLEAAILSGIPTIALCGKVWLPTRDATRFPVCVDCKKVYDQMGAW